ncbi:hypothetical protein D9M71_592890 [compost metagenome]
MFDQGALHVEGTDSIAGGGDHIIAATDETDAAIGIQFDRVTTEVVLADECLGHAALVAVEPAQRRLLAVHRKDARLPCRQFLVVFVQHHDAMAGHRKARRAHVHRVLQAMVVAQHHAQFGLAIMVVDGHAKVVGKPANHFGVKRLTGAADHPQATLDAGGEGLPISDQKAVGSRRTGQVGDGVFLDDAASAFNAERAIEERGRMAK